MNTHSADTNDQLCTDLIEHGFAVGRAKSGNLLRVDSRTCKNPVHVDMLARILQSSTLRELYLRGSEGINEFATQIANLRKLRVLDVEGSDFSDDSLHKLSTMEQLEVINLRGTCVTPPMIAELRKKMIGTRMIGP